MLTTALMTGFLTVRIQHLARLGEQNGQLDAKLLRAVGMAWLALG